MLFKTSRKRQEFLDTDSHCGQMKVSYWSGMANTKHIEILRKGTKVWNSWRKRHPRTIPDFENSVLNGIVLDFGANLTRAKFSGANLARASLEGAELEYAILNATDLSKSYLRKANLNYADLRGANLSFANLHRVHMDYADLRNSTLRQTKLDLGSCSKAKFHGSRITNMEFDADPFSDRYGFTDFLALSSASGLDQLHPKSRSFLQKYIQGVLEYVDVLHAPYTMEIKVLDRHAKLTDKNPVIESRSTYKGKGIGHDNKYIKEVLDRIKVLEQIYRKADDPPELVRAISTVNLELIKYIRKHPDTLRNLHWRTFESLIAELLSGFGWEVQLTQPTKDNGYDILGVHRDAAGISHTWIIECKQWGRERKVGVEIARSLYTVKAELKVGGALLATTSDFTKGVRDFKASRYDFELRNYDGVVEWINAYAGKKHSV